MNDLAIARNANETAEAAVEPLLELSELSVAFGNGEDAVQVIDKVTLRVHPGEIVGIVGESGSGKSVTCMTSAGLIGYVGGRVIGGQIRLNGIDLTGAGPSEWRKMRPDVVSMIFQQPTRSLNPAHTIGRQIAESLKRNGRGTGAEAKQRAIELLARVDIPRPEHTYSAYPHMLSGGMCQRVMIAMALACEPKLLIADEPTTALDVTVQKGILELLERLRTDLGLAILYVSHDLAVVEDICDRVNVMYGGQIVESAAAFDVFDAPAHPYSAGLIASTPTLSGHGRLGFIPGSVPQPGSWPTGCHFASRCQFATAGLCDIDPIRLFDRGFDHLVRCLRFAEIEADLKREVMEIR